jgi:signal transduction histidine kinase
VNAITVYQTEIALKNLIMDLHEYNYRVFGIKRDVKLALSLENKFRERLYYSIVLVSFFSVLLSILIGAFVANLITKPLKRLKIGLRKLRRTKEYGKLKFTGNSEIDEVIYEFNKLNDELIFQKKLRQSLIADISHEFKTPLTALSAQIHSIKDGVLKLTDKRFNLISQQIERLNSLVDDLNNYTQMQSELKNIKREEFSLYTLVEDVIKNYTENLEKRKMEVQINNIKNITICGDKDRLYGVFENFFVNSIKYSQASTIIISVDLNNNAIKFSDNGIGISDEHLPYIFERFYRVDKSRNRNSGGLGLGLAIVRDIVKAHNWEIKIKSDINKGVEFTIYCGRDIYKS